MKLFSRLFDNSGRLKLRDQVKRNGHVIKTYTTAFMSTPSAETGFVNWPAPAEIKGTITHCVRAQDRAGNVSTDHLREGHAELAEISPGPKTKTRLGRRPAGLRCPVAYVRLAGGMKASLRYGRRVPREPFSRLSRHPPIG